MLDEHTDTFIINDHSYELMTKLRSKIMMNFKTVWLYLYKAKEDDKWEIAVANRWGGKLDSETVSAVKFFATEFMLNEENQEEILK